MSCEEGKHVFNWQQGILTGRYHHVCTVCYFLNRSISKEEYEKNCVCDCRTPVIDKGCAMCCGKEPRKEGIKVPPDRKGLPLFSGCLMYFPDALLAVAEHSKKGNDKHNPGQPLHWSKDKSKDHADCAARHLVDIGPTWDALDPETQSLHATALAWRALALLQTVLDRSKSPSGV